jgi:hypothetical protein
MPREVNHLLVGKRGARVAELRAAIATDASRVCIIRTRIIDDLEPRAERRGRARPRRVHK